MDLNEDLPPRPLQKSQSNIYKASDKNIDELRRSIERASELIEQNKVNDSGDFRIKVYNVDERNMVDWA